MCVGESGPDPSSAFINRPSICLLLLRNRNGTFFSVTCICRDAGQEEHDHVLVLSRAVRGHHVYDTDSTEDAVLLFQFNRALCTDIVDGAARIHTAT